MVGLHKIFQKRINDEFNITHMLKPRALRKLNFTVSIKSYCAIFLLFAETSHQQQCIGSCVRRKVLHFMFVFFKYLFVVFFERFLSVPAIRAHFSLLANKNCLKSNYSDRKLEILDRQIIIRNTVQSPLNLI